MRPPVAEVALAAIRREVEDWSDADVLRLAALVRLGPPAEVVDRGFASSAVDHEGGDAPGTVGLRARGGPEAGARSAALAAWRAVGEHCGLPLPPPHPRRIEAPAPPGRAPAAAARREYAATPTYRNPKFAENLKRGQQA